MKANHAVMLGALLALAGCSQATGEGAAREVDTSAEASVREISPTEVAALQKQNAVKVFDANTDDFRAEHGKIPGAVLLASSSKLDVSVLGADKDAKLVFYCSNRL